MLLRTTLRHPLSCGWWTTSRMPTDDHWTCRASSFLSFFGGNGSSSSLWSCWIHRGGRAKLWRSRPCPPVADQVLLFSFSAGSALPSTHCTTVLTGTCSRATRTAPASCSSLSGVLLWRRSCPHISLRRLAMDDHGQVLLIQGETYRCLCFGIGLRELRWIVLQSDRSIDQLIPRLACQEVAHVELPQRIVWLVSACRSWGCPYLPSCQRKRAAVSLRCLLQLWWRCGD